MKKINWEPIGKFAKTACEVLVYGALAVASVKFSESATRSYGMNTTATYGDAVGAIMDSDMSSYYKNEAIGMLKRNGTMDYYGAVVKVINNTSTSSYYKLSMIETLNEE